MINTSVVDPPIAQIAAALRKTTERLALELACPAATPPVWTDFEWRIARAVSAMQGISSLLCTRLRWEGPSSWMRFLQDQQKQTLKRHMLISRVLSTVDSLARREGLPLVALKGAALHALGIYVAGERPMGDIDILVRSEDTEAIARLLASCGYEEAYLSRRHQTFRPALKSHRPEILLGEHIDNPIKIEVHSRIGEQLPRVDITQFLLSSEATQGINAYPSTASLMMHLLLHAAGNMRAHALRLIQLHDIALLAGRLGADDWEEMLAARACGRVPWWALAPLTLTNRYYPEAVPPTVLSRVAAECPWLLASRVRRQRLADVSWSNIRIAAFPGIEWSRTPREALGFVWSRIWPSDEALSELKDGAAQVPAVTTVPWYGISHSARIMRWVFSRPPRVQTLLSVRAALAKDP